MAKALLTALGFTASCMVASVASIVSVASVAHAEERDPAAAQALFDEGRALMKTQRFAEACPKLKESQRLDPGIGTQFRLADCYELQGKVASAWAAFLEVASLAAASDQKEREKAARDRAARLESRLPRLRIVVPQENRIPGLEVTRDGMVVGPAQWESGMPVDPGEHQLTASAPERRSFSATVTVKEGASTSFQVPGLFPVAEGSAPVGAPGPTGSPQSQAQPVQQMPPPGQMSSPPIAADTREKEPSSGPSYLVIGLGGLGVVGLVAGTTLGFMAKSKFEDSKKSCNPGNENLCGQHGVDLRNDAFTLGNESTVGFIVGGVALAGAGVLWLTSGSSKPSEAQSHGLKVMRAGVQATPIRSTLVVEGSF